MKSMIALLAAVLLFIANRAGAQIIDRSKPLGKDPEAFMSAQNARSQQAFALRREGQKAMRQGDNAKAISLLKQAVQLDDDPEATDALADIYIGLKQPREVLNALRHIVYPPHNVSYSNGKDERTRMKYVLALLDTKQWAEAATLYEQSMREYEQDYGKMLWFNRDYTSGYGGHRSYALPDAHFSPDAMDEPGLRAQAHLILGSRPPLDAGPTVDQDKQMQYQLDHVQQAIKYAPRSAAAYFLSGTLLGQIKRFGEARAAFARAAQFAPRESQPEIKSVLAGLDAREKEQKFQEAQQAKQPTGAQPQPTARP